MHKDANHRSAERRHFSQLRLLLLIAVVLDFEISANITLFKQYYQQDLDYCPTCFTRQRVACDNFLASLEPVSASSLGVDGLLTIVLEPFLGEHRANTLLQQRHIATPIIAKYYGRHKQGDAKPNITDILQRLHDAGRLDGCQYCPATTVQRFMSLAGTGGDDLTNALYLLNNVQLYLLPILNAQRFPVPPTLAICGFTIYEAYVGQSLAYYYKVEFVIKARIAVQLLRAALRFTEGIDGFRLYITDLTADNIVYEALTNRLYIVDLDTVLMVDSRSPDVSKHVHKHMPIECDDCFAYVPQDICAAQRSDLNLYAACQFLRENSRRDRTKGFLQPIPVEIQAAYPELLQLLDNCVDCAAERCSDRFTSSYELIQIFEFIELHLQGK